MRKLVLILTIFFTGFLTGCSEEIPEVQDPELKEILPEDLITMDILDEYMERLDVQYVDLRNLDAKFRSGYIKHFETIPFFDYLDNRAFDRGGSYEFHPDQILNEALLRITFDEDKAIFLYADGCVRSAYLKDVLNYIGYERVYVLGGYYEYDGAYNILGDGYFDLGNSAYLVHVSDDGTVYSLGVRFDMAKAIIDIRIDIVDSFGVSLRSTGYSEDVDYNEQLTILEDFILDQYTTMYRAYTRMSDPEINEYDEIEGYTMGFDDELLALFMKLNMN